MGCYQTWGLNVTIRGNQDDAEEFIAEISGIGHGIFFSSNPVEIVEIGDGRFSRIKSLGNKYHLSCNSIVSRAEEALKTLKRNEVIRATVIYHSEGDMVDTEWTIYRKAKDWVRQVEFTNVM